MKCDVRLPIGAGSMLLHCSLVLHYLGSVAGNFFFESVNRSRPVYLWFEPAGGEPDASASGTSGVGLPERASSANLVPDHSQTVVGAQRGISGGYRCF